MKERDDLTEQLAKLKDWYDQWESSTRESRELAERDRRYYDGIQWSKEELSELARRQQPPLTKNKIAKKINFLIGMEIRDRVDPRALPRTAAHETDSEPITDAIRSVVDTENFDQSASWVWENLLVEGYGGGLVEHEIVTVATPKTSQAQMSLRGVTVTQTGEITKRIEPRIKHVPWDRLWYDTFSRRPDFADACHLGVTEWFDLDEALRVYGNRRDAVENFEEVLTAAVSESAQTGDTHDDKPTHALWSQNAGKRKRVRVNTCYYRKDRDWYVAHYTTAGFLVTPRLTGYVDDSDSPHNQCPLKMTSCYVDQEGNRYGIVRPMISPQDEHNKRASKALHWLSVDRMVAEEDAILDPDGVVEERAKPDSVVIVQRDALSTRRIEFENGLAMGQGQLQLLQESKQDIAETGPEIPQIGTVGGASSGRALQIRQQIGTLEIAKVQDNHKAWRRAMYEQVWYRIRQFWTDETWLRVRDDSDRNGYRFSSLNRKMTRGERFMELIGKRLEPMKALESVMPSPVARELASAVTQAAQGQINQQLQAMAAQAAANGAGPSQIQPPDQSAVQQMVIQMILRLPVMQEMLVASDVAQIGVDIVLAETPDTAILQYEEFENIAQVLPTVISAKPELAPTMLEILIEASQLRSKKRILEILRQPPDQAAIQAQQQAAQMQQASVQAGIVATQAKAQLDQARAAGEAAKAQTVLPTAQADIQNTQADTLLKGQQADAAQVQSAARLAGD